MDEGGEEKQVRDECPNEVANEGKKVNTDK